MIKTILAIETSCDDTSVAVIRHDGWVEGMVSANQDFAHSIFGGVVPEIASRNHTLTLLPLIEECLKKSQKKWSDIEGVAVTSRPGLMGSLMVGVVTAKTLAMTHEIPLIGVNHLEGHLLAPFLEDELYKPQVSLKELLAEDQPYLALAISGGHTQLYEVTAPHKYKVLGRTVDDAAGEAFDKLAKMLGLPFPGGVAVDRLSQGGQRSLYAFPRPMIH
ncbi:MAG: tRNA (adenosine(37)-N6)-threonylcarbamoyltransferase complex transferase subunit TsaD, partial [Bdellovibrionota bacterium]